MQSPNTNAESGQMLVGLVTDVLDPGQQVAGLLIGRQDLLDVAELTLEALDLSFELGQPLLDRLKQAANDEQKNAIRDELTKTLVEV